MNLKELLKNVEVEQYNGTLDEREITSLCTDSKTAIKDSIYIALPGTKTDGQNFIADAVNKGSKVVLCSLDWLNKGEDKLSLEVIYIAVKDRRKAFAQISSNFYHNPTKNLLMIGVTGTNGKTTSTHIIENILIANGANTGLLGTLYTKYADVKHVAKYTTPMPNELQETFHDMVAKGVKEVIMEVSSHALQQQRVGTIDFSLAIFTNLTQDHLDYHSTFESYREAKLILFNQLVKDNGHSIINLDDPSAKYFIDASKAKVITFGLSDRADIYATDIKLRMDGTSFIAHTPLGNIDLEMKLVGKFNVYNALTALACGFALNIPLEVCKIALENTQGVAGRIEIVTPPSHPYTVVVDYAHTPDSLDNVLKTAREFTHNRLISVFGCGGDRDKTKRPIMGGIASRLSDIAIVTSDNPRTEEPSDIIDDILKGIPEKEKVIIEVDRQKAIEKAIEIVATGDTVVIAGKGHEDYQIFRDKTIHFDDREMAREFIKLKK